MDDAEWLALVADEVEAAEAARALVADGVEVGSRGCAGG